MLLDTSVTVATTAKDHVKIGDSIEVMSQNFHLSQLDTSEQQRMISANRRGAGVLGIQREGEGVRISPQNMGIGVPLTFLILDRYFIAVKRNSDEVDIYYVP